MRQNVADRVNVEKSHCRTLSITSMTRVGQPVLPHWRLAFREIPWLTPGVLGVDYNPARQGGNRANENGDNIITMDPALEYAQTKVPEIVQSIRRMVECESPSDDPAAVNRFVDLFTAEIADIAKVRTFKSGRFGKHMRCEFQLPGRKKSGQILGLGHSDTVYPLGILPSMPWREKDGRLHGPGVLDMKGGLAFFIWAMRALRELDIPVARKVILQVNSDEEVGSESSRPLTEEAARQSVAVLVLEPGTGPTGKLKTARKGVGDYTVKVRGVAAHAGVDFTSGASAIVELARQIERIASFTKLDRGITVNPGV